MSTRWTHRPEGSTWGDWGDDDELGRINLLTPEKVRQGVREVEEGISFCLSLPLDYPGGTALNQRRYPPVLAPTEDMHGVADTFYNVRMSEMQDWGNPKYVDVWADDQVTLSLQYSTQWDSLAHVGAEFDADGDGVEEAVYYNGYSAGVDLAGPTPDAAGDGGQHLCFAHHLGLEHMAYQGVQGRGVLVDLAHHLGQGNRSGPKLLQELAHARVHNGIARHRERKPVDDHATQLIARHVHSLPERRRGEQNAVRRRAKLFQQRVARPGSLHQRRIIDFQRHPVVHQPHLLVAGEQYEGAAARGVQYFVNYVRRPP